MKNTPQAFRVIRPEPDFHEKFMLLRRLPDDATANVRAVWEMGARDWNDGRYVLRAPSDPIYMSGWHDANRQYAEHITAQRAKESA